MSRMRILIARIDVEHTIEPADELFRCVRRAAGAL
jgi:hypothetical protein